MSPGNLIFFRYLQREILFSQFPIVRYIPAEQDLPIQPGIENHENQSGVRDVVLESQNARCYICLTDFVPPGEAPSDCEDNSVLKMLPCEHVFHVSTDNQRNLLV